MPQYLSTDPNAGASKGYLSTDPMAGATPVSAPKETRSPARIQGDERWGEYVAETAGNFFPDLWEQVKGAGSLALTVGGATAEFGTDIGSTIRDVVGLDPKYLKERPNQATLKAFPSLAIQHYGGYLDPNTRAEQVRDHPVGTILDIAGAIKGGSMAAGAAQKAWPAIRAVASHPMARLAGGAALDTATSGLPIATGAIAAKAIFDRLRPAPSHTPTAPPSSPPPPAAPPRLIDLLGDPQAFLDAVNARLGPVPQPRRATVVEPDTPMPSHPTAKTPATTLSDELMLRDPDWRTTDAVPIDAIQRDITRGGSILEAGESQIGLGERLAAAMRKAAKGDVKAATEAEMLARALHQRMHIAERVRRARTRGGSAR